MSEALLVVDVSGRVMRTNRAAKTLLQLRDDGAVGQRAIDLLRNPEIPSTPAELLARDPGGRLLLETELAFGSGKKMAVGVSCGTVKDRTGNVTGLLLVVRDISERKQAEEARSRLAAIVESSDDAIISKDLNGTITNWNAGATRLFGYSPEEVIGKSILVLFPPELQHEELGILAKIRAGERIEHYESQRVTKQGKRIEVSLTISPVRDGSGRLIGASKIARDITARKQTEEMLRRTEKLATAGRLAASIAHEINNPLAAVTNLLYLMKKRPAKLNEYLELATQELDRVIHISKQTLGFYRDSSVAATVNVAALLDSVLRLYARRLESRAIRVKTDYDQESYIMALEGELRQLFSNLILNALDAMGDGGTLQLKVSRAHSWKQPGIWGVRVTIADSGSGIAPEHKKNIFEAFYTTKTDIGTGLGLWLAQGIVKKHNGMIRFRSSTAPGASGTVFSVFLPYNAVQQAGRAETAASLKP
jgi:PAS domain S-box-containing protein